MGAFIGALWAEETNYTPFTHRAREFAMGVLRHDPQSDLILQFAGPDQDVGEALVTSYSKLKEALRVCAAFRRIYLDFKDKADDQNAKNISENAEKLAARPNGNLFNTKMYGPHAYTPRYGLRQMDGGSSTDSLNEEELWTHSPWPARNAPCFDLLNSFMERCNGVLELW